MESYATDSFFTLTAWSQAIAQGEVTPRELVERCLAEVETWEKTIRAWVRIDQDEAFRQADTLGEELKQGTSRGPLHGIPFGVKDIFDLQGVLTCNGSPIRDQSLPQQDAEIVGRLRAAGAIFLGKTVTTEYACFDPPPTRNPWNVRHTPGGSSSGSAAAVATGMCAAALGSQTGGSITRPASYCGVTGYKPTFDRYSRRGVTPVSFSLDHVGFLARCVPDLILLTQTLAEEDTLPTLSKPPRLGILDQMFVEDADPDAGRVLRAAVDRCKSRGAEIVSLALPNSFQDISEMHRRIMATEAAEFHYEHFRDHEDELGPLLHELLEEGLSMPAIDYAEALKYRLELLPLMEVLFKQVDAFLTPATVSAAPSGLTSTGSPLFNSPWSFLGTPTVSFPVGYADNGLPMGVQLVGARGTDQQLLNIAQWVDDLLRWRSPPPKLSGSFE
ncbi:Glutamyl-tRNA amidotransferase subunit A [Planctomycetales bacterium 10988]|nr:Glutamyl-tRNA amidotransferase subunit A [Planctomycetales bacterium 10988]